MEVGKIEKDEKVVLAFAVGALGSYVQGEALEMWYPNLVKSAATPPAILFPVAWGLLYLLMSLSAGVMLARGDVSVMRLWLLQLLLNFLWSVCFFALRSPFLGLLVILALDVTVFAYIVYASARHSLAAWLFVPYMLWLIFATYLNGYIYINNRTTQIVASATAASSAPVATKFEMADLPYAANALMPAMSEETIYYHYGKHYRAYVDNTNRLIVGTPYEGMPLEEIVKKSEGTLFNNAAQALNHQIYFEGMTPVQKVMPRGLKNRIVRDFGSVENFNREFESAAVSLFGSGWVWLAEDDKGKLSIMAAKNADNPICHNLNPLMCIDVWEHAYYLDHQNRRSEFIGDYMQVVDWERVAARSKFEQ